MKLNFWRIGAKTVLVAVLAGVVTVFERFIHPVASSQSAVAQLADTAESSAQMAAYGWIIPAGWFVVALVFVVFVVTEAWAITQANKKEAVR